MNYSPSTKNDKKGNRPSIFKRASMMVAPNNMTGQNQDKMKNEITTIPNYSRENAHIKISHTPSNESEVKIIVTKN